MSAADFASAKGERFAVALVGEDGAPTQNVVVQVGMDGLFLMSPDASRTFRKFPLSHIARWATPPSAGGAALVLYTRTPVDVEEVTLTLSGNPPTIRAVLDTLTCCCMQMVELLESEREASAANAESNGAPSSSSSRRRHSSGGFRRRKAPPALPAAEDVEFWHSPEKQGWLQSQGDHIKTWRRRWHVLKQGYLFRFASESDASAGPNSRPRGVVDLSKITDVSGSSSGGGSTTTATMIRLSTPQGASISYLADSETEAVEWMSALESSVARIVRAVAGFDEEGDENENDGDNGRRSRSARGNNNTGSGRPSRPPSSSQEQQQQQPFDAANSAAASLAAAGGNPFISVVGYEGVLSGGAAAAPSPSSYPSHQQHQQHYAPTAPIYGDGGGAGGAAGFDRGGGGEMAGGAVFGGGPTFGGVSGVSGVAPVSAPSPYAGGGGYPAVPDPQGAAVAAYVAPSYAPYQPVQQQPQPQAQQPRPQPAAAPAPALPEPWQVLYTSDGRAYFYNSATNATQWEPPQAASLV